MKDPRLTCVNAVVFEAVIGDPALTNLLQCSFKKNQVLHQLNKSALQKVQTKYYQIKEFLFPKLTVQGSPGAPGKVGPTGQPGIRVSI